MLASSRFFPATAVTTEQNTQNDSALTVVQCRDVLFWYEQIYTSIILKDVTTFSFSIPLTELALYCMLAQHCMQH
jgi:hypothetical protein